MAQAISICAPMPRVDGEDDTEGVPRRISELYQAHARAVAVRLRRMSGDAELARDLAQDAFVVAMRRIDEAPDDPPPAAWLHAIAYNLLRDHRRSSQRRRALLARLLRRGTKQAALVGEGPSTPSSLGERIDQALGRLDDDQRDAFVLRMVEGLSLQEAATLLGTTVQTVSHRAKRAEQIVRGYFEEEHGA
ncbi:MAG: sigma-70 family RNA polymerase sigma factor [Myxococcales bacterium]|nr:sigma-70 family RNA polymerase sigma factor [Myxococcales bacterium]